MFEYNLSSCSPDFIGKVFQFLANQDNPPEFYLLDEMSVGIEKDNTNNRYVVVIYQIENKWILSELPF